MLMLKVFHHLFSYTKELSLTCSDTILQKVPISNDQIKEMTISTESNLKNTQFLIIAVQLITLWVQNVLWNLIHIHHK